MGLPLRGQGFTSGSQARRVRQAESSSSSCGLVSHLRLLPTPPLGDAVTFGYRPESVCLKRTCTSLNVCARGRTDRRRPAGSSMHQPLPPDMSHCLGIWAVSVDMARCLGIWAVAPRYEALFRDIRHCLGIYGVVWGYGALSRDMRRICGQWPVVPGYGAYLWTMARCPQIWAISADMSRCPGTTAHCLWIWPVVSRYGAHLLVIAARSERVQARPGLPQTTTNCSVNEATVCEPGGRLSLPVHGNLLSCCLVSVILSLLTELSLAQDLWLRCQVSSPLAATFQKIIGNRARVQVSGASDCPAVSVSLDFFWK